MGYYVIYANLRIALFIAGHFHVEPEYLKELYNEFLAYGNSIPASNYMHHFAVPLLFFSRHCFNQFSEFMHIFHEFAVPHVA